MDNIFIRGNTYVLNNVIFYFAARDKNNKYYYLTSPIPNEKLVSNMVFTPTNYLNTFDSLITSSISKDLDSLYTVKGHSPTSSTGYFISKNNVVDLYPENLGTKFKFKNLNTNLPENNLYPGVWYKLIENDKEVLWKIQKCKKIPFTIACSEFTNEILTDTLDIMLIPVNSDLGKNGNTPGPKNLSIWKNNDCRTAFGYPQLGLEWFDAFYMPTSVNSSIQPINCYGPEYLTDTSNNCFFTNLESCLQKYLYVFCKGDEYCGDCLGKCETSDRICLHDYNPSYKDENIPPLSCDPKFVEPVSEIESIWELYKTEIIIIISIVVVLAIIIIIILAVMFSKKK